MGSSHEHSDRGTFTLFSHGRMWAKVNFRSVETRHHNSILIDGMGQGFWPGPGEWLDQETKGDMVLASVDVKDAYHWWWPKQILTESADFIRFQYKRWESYAKEAATFREEYRGVPVERDTRPAVVAFWKGFERTDPRIWDEDGWPVRLPHNPVRRAFRSVAFCKGIRPWLLVVDDVQKDGSERLYEWLMQTGLNTDVAAISGNDIVLADASVPRDASGAPVLKTGDRCLLVRVLEAGEPEGLHEYQSKPSFRLETFERRDTLERETREGLLSGARTFGMDKRLVIASRAVAPDFKILLFPHRHGEALPVTGWNAPHYELRIDAGGDVRTFHLRKNDLGRTVISMK